MFFSVFNAAISEKQKEYVFFSPGRTVGHTTVEEIDLKESSCIEKENGIDINMSLTQNTQIDKNAQSQLKFEDDPDAVYDVKIKNIKKKSGKTFITFEITGVNEIHPRVNQTEEAETNQNRANMEINKQESSFNFEQNSNDLNQNGEFHQINESQNNGMFEPVSETQPNFTEDSSSYEEQSPQEPLYQ